MEILGGYNNNKDLQGVIKKEENKQPVEAKKETKEEKIEVKTEEKKELVERKEEKKDGKKEEKVIEPKSETSNIVQTIKAEAKTES
jgi:hypothetical protein